MLYSLKLTDLGMSDGKALKIAKTRSHNKIPKTSAGYCWPLWYQGPAVKEGLESHSLADALKFASSDVLDFLVFDMLLGAVPWSGRL